MNKAENGILVFLLYKECRSSVISFNLELQQMYFSISYEMQFLKNVVILILSAWQNVISKVQEFLKYLLKFGFRQHVTKLSGICNLCKPNKSVVPYMTNTSSASVRLPVRVGATSLIKGKINTEFVLRYINTNLESFQLKSIKLL